MAFGLSNALFYSVDVNKRVLANLILGTTEPPALDTVEFEKENGGEAIRQLALPRLSGMDEVEIEVAQMGIRSVGRPIEISNFSQQGAPGNQGVFLTLPKPGRLLSVEVEYVTPPLAPGQTRTDHVVIRDVKKSNSGMDGGVPLFAEPALPAPGDMFPATLAGMSRVSLGSNRFRLTLPSVLGDAWLIQLASGEKAVDLKPLAASV